MEARPISARKQSTAKPEKGRTRNGRCRRRRASRAIAAGGESEAQPKRAARLVRDESRRGPKHWPTRVGWHTLRAVHDEVDDAVVDRHHEQTPPMAKARRNPRGQPASCERISPRPEALADPPGLAHTSDRPCLTASSRHAMIGALATSATRKSPNRADGNRPLLRHAPPRPWLAPS